MDNNDILRRLRYALDIKNSEMIEIFKHSNQDVDEKAVTQLLRKDDKADFLVCSDVSMRAFLNGLITHKRGPSTKEAPPEEAELTNNLVLKKIRIALELKEGDMLSVLKLGGMRISASELSALFRRKDHKHYKECGDQLLRNFLSGLATKMRPPVA